MAQQKRVVRQYQEYPGSVFWKDYEILCPGCGNWSDNYGEVDELQPNGEWYYLCEKCAKLVIEEQGNDFQPVEIGSHEVG